MEPRLVVRDGVAPEWAALSAGGSLFTSPGWLRAMDGRLGAAPTTFVIYDGDRPVLAALGSVQATHRPGEFFDPHHVLISPAPALPLASPARTRRAALAATAPPPPAWLPALVVMLPGYECVPVGAADDVRLVDALVDGVAAWAAGRGLRTVAYLYLRPEEKVLAGALASRGYHDIPLSITWDLPVPATGLPGYLADLPRKHRTEARREMARLGDAGVEVRALTPDELVDDDVFDRLVALRAQLVAKYRGRVDPAAEAARLRRLVDDVAGGAPRVLTARTGSEIIGYALFAAWGDAWHCLGVGYDYDEPRSRLAYFATVFYGAVPLAAEAGVRSLGYGQGSSAAKRSRGCVGVPLRGLVSAADPALDAALRESAGITELDTARLDAV